jgi:RND family efflux transporter MFP subunit
MLTPEMIKRAGIELAPVGTSTPTGSLRIPGVVEPNGYREVTATSLADGRITKVLAELGQRVTKGQTLAEMYSPQLAELQTTFLGMRAELDAAHDRLTRTERLVQIGAASRQELEQIHAEHARHEAALEGARARLLLLGVSNDQLNKLSSADTTATVSVPAPIDGMVTKRDANAGMNVQAAAPLFTIVDLSTVWIIADLYESSFSSVRVGSAAVVTTDAYSGLSFDGRVSYIDPQVQASTRTAKVRIEVPNRGEQLRLGMFVNVAIDNAAGGAGIAIAQSAVQTVGDRHVVYVADPAQDGRFIERDVRLGEGSGGQVTILDGLKPDDRVVTNGAFFVRAERERTQP